MHAALAAPSAAAAAAARPITGADATPEMTAALKAPSGVVPPPGSTVMPQSAHPHAAHHMHMQQAVRFVPSGSFNISHTAVCLVLPASLTCLFTSYVTCLLTECLCLVLSHGHIISFLRVYLTPATRRDLNSSSSHRRT